MQFFLFKFDQNFLLLLIALIVGIFSGIAAVGLNSSIAFVSEFVESFHYTWYSFLFPGIGAALSAIFLEKIIREGSGHGVPEVIYSVGKYGGLLRFRSIFSRLVSSTLTIGSGGSAGPEAPVVISGAAIGSNIAKFFSLNERQRITLVGCGAAAAISAIFNAPVAGIIFTLEVILAEWNSVYLVPVAIASVAGTEISIFLKGNQIPFKSSGFSIGFEDVLAAAVLAILTAMVSVLFTRAMEKNHHVAEKTASFFKLPFWLKAGIGGCIVGLIGYFLPDSMGEGYHSVREMISGVYSNGMTMVAICMLAKILTTSITLGWGGSGGIFAPALVIGSFTGVLFFRISSFLFPELHFVSEGCFALLGMSGVMAGVLQAPLTGVFLIVEITGSYEVIVPLIIVSTLSSTLCRYLEPASLYLKELVEKGQLLRPGTDSRVLSDLKISELIEKDCINISPDLLLKDVVSMLKVSKRNFFPVVDKDSMKFIGIVKFDNIRPYLLNPLLYESVFVYQIMDKTIPTIQYREELKDALDLMDKRHLFSIPVLDDKKFLGLLSKATILDQYRRELKVQTSEV